MPFLKPSPERQGLRGTEAWRRTTVRTFFRLVFAGTLLAFAPDSIGPISNDAAAQRSDSRAEDCFTPANLRAAVTMRGTMAVRAQIVRTGKEVCAGIPASAFAEDQQELIELASGPAIGQEAAS